MSAANTRVTKSTPYPRNVMLRPGGLLRRDSASMRHYRCSPSRTPPCISSRRSRSMRRGAGRHEPAPRRSPRLRRDPHARRPVDRPTGAELDRVLRGRPAARSLITVLHHACGEHRGRLADGGCRARLHRLPPAHGGGWEPGGGGAIVLAVWIDPPHSAHRRRRGAAHARRLPGAPLRRTRGTRRSRSGCGWVPWPRRLAMYDGLRDGGCLQPSRVPTFRTAYT